MLARGKVLHGRFLASRSEDEARALLEESTALRRTLGFTAGVAANLVGLIYLADGDEATISAQIEEARSRL